MIEKYDLEKLICLQLRDFWRGLAEDSVTGARAFQFKTVAALEAYIEEENVASNSNAKQVFEV